LGDFKASYFTIEEFYKVFDYIRIKGKYYYKLVEQDEYRNEWFQLVDLQENKVIAWDLESLEKLIKCIN
jgi:hypothetical protein